MASGKTCHPIAAMAILSKIGQPKNLETVVDGESQNDCVTVILFTILVGLAVGSSSAPGADADRIFAREVLGKCALDLNGWLTDALPDTAIEIPTHTSLPVSLGAGACM